MKKVTHLSIVVVLIAVFLIAGASIACAKTVASGKCGAEVNNATWVLDDRGVLTISGTGAIKDYDVENNILPPWYTYLYKSVEKVVVNEGITVIGNDAFCDLDHSEGSAIQKISLPTSLTKIGEYAFYNCNSISIVTIPPNVEQIGYCAFYFCSDLSDVIIYSPSITFLPSSKHGYKEERPFVNWRTVHMYVIKESALESFLKGLDVDKYDMKHTCAIGQPQVEHVWNEDRECANCDVTEELLCPEHDMDAKVVADRYLKSKATCASPAVYYYSCSKCGKAEYYRTFKYGEKTNDHQFIQDSDPSEYYLATPATYAAPATYYERCKVCNAKGTKTYSHGEPRSHTTDKDVDPSMIPDDDLREVLQILANYWGVTGKDFYEEVVIAKSLDPNTVDITDPQVVPEAAEYNKTVKQDVLEGYPGTINLRPYSDKDINMKGIAYADSATEIVLPDGITAIPSKAFYEMSSLATVVMPSTVTSIGDSAFEKCKSLAAVKLTGDTSEEAQTLVNLKYVQNIERSAFASCKKITKIGLYEGEGGITIQSNAFDSCTSLKAADIPAGTLGTGIFSSCYDLEQVTFDDSYTKIPDNTFVDVTPYRGLTVTLPAELKEIGNYAFWDCDIYNMNLADCSKLEKISEYAFRDAAFRTWNPDLSGNDKLTTIGMEAFAGAAFIYHYNVKLPDSVNKMGISVFFGASGMRSVNIPDALTSIPAGTFMACGDLENVIVTEKAQFESVEDHAFDLCINLKNTDFLANSKKLTTIGEYAFARCMPTGPDYNLYLEDKIRYSELYGLKKITIPDTVTSIGASAFENNIMATEAKLGAGITEVPQRALYCESGTSISFQDVTLEDPISGKTMTYPFKSESGEGSWYQQLRKLMSGYGKPLYQLSSLVWVNLNKNVEAVGDYAFYGNGDLLNVGYYDETTTLSGVKLGAVRSVGEYAFAYCGKHTGSYGDGKDPLSISGIQTVELPAALTIGKNAFFKDEALYKVTLSKDLEEIPESCFAECGYREETGTDGQGNKEYYYSGLTTVTSANGFNNLKSIGEKAFQKCYCLTGFSFGQNLESIGANAFENTDITTAEALSKSSLKKIAKATFQDCRALTVVYCPDSLESIEDDAFKNCPKLKEVSFPVYASLSKKMIDGDYQKMTLKPTLGRYIGSRYKVPLDLTIELPANAFARRSDEVISQVDDQGKESQLVPIDPQDPPDPQYFDVEHKSNSYTIGGKGIPIKNAAVRISATIPFDNSVDRVMNIDYPVDVVNVSADPDSIGFDESDIKIDGKAGGTIVANPGKDPVLYVDSTKAGKVLTLAAHATADKDVAGEYNLGMITDPAKWVVESGDALTAKEGSVTKTTSSEICKTTGGFTIAKAGTSVAKVYFDDGTANPPARTLTVAVLEPISKIDFYVQSLGVGHTNAGSLTMPIGQTDTIIATPEYTNPEDTRDFVKYRSSDKTVATVDDQGNITAEGPGKATITMEAATGHVSKTMSVTVIKEGDPVAPTFVEITGPVSADKKSQVYVGESAEYAVKYLPAYATPGASWSLNDTTETKAKLTVTADNKAVVQGLAANTSVRLTVKADNGGKTDAVEISIVQKSTAVEFREAAPTIGTGDVKNMRLTSADDPQTVTGGIVRTPASSWEEVTFTSSDPEVLTLAKTNSATAFADSVTLSGQSATLYYKGLKQGKATITAQSASGAKDTLEVTVVDPITSIQCLNNVVTLLNGATENMLLEKTPADSWDTVKFQSSNEKAATVDENGKITAVASGAATITARTGLKNLSATCKVTVRNKADALVYRSNAPLVAVIDTVKSMGITSADDPSIVASGVVRTPGSSDEHLTFTSSDPSVVVLGASSSGCTEETVKITNKSGSLYYKGLQKGKATITAESESGKKVIISVNSASTIKSLDYSIDSFGTEHKNQSTVTMPAGQKDSITAMPVYTDPEDTGDYVTYTSSDASVVTVDRAGKMEAVGEGTAKITVAAASGSVNRSFTVNVAAAGQAVAPAYVEEITAEDPPSGDPAKLYLRDEFKTVYSARCLPTYASQEVEWSLSGTSGAAELASLENGKAQLTGVKNGSIRLKAKAKNANVSKELSIAVSKKPAPAEIHVDKDTLQFDNSKFKVGSSAAGTIQTKILGNPVLYVNRTKTGQTLTLAAEALSEDIDYPGLITDPVTWEVTSGNSLVLNADSVKTTTSETAAKLTTTASFDIMNDSTATVNLKINDGSLIPPTLKLDIVMIDPIKSVDYTLGLIGEKYNDPSSISMTAGMTDTIDVTAVYMNEEDKRDQVLFTSSDESVVTVDEKGQFKAAGPGRATIKIASASGNVSRSFTVNVKGEGEAIEPTYIEITGKTGSDKKGYVFAGESAEYAVNYIPSYATQGVKWSTGETPDAQLSVTEDNKAIVKGINANKTVTLRATANAGGASSSLGINIIQKASQLVFQEKPPLMGTGDVKSFRITGSDDPASVKDGIVRVPAGSSEDIKFSSSDPKVLTLGTSNTDCGNSSVVAKSGSVYYKGLHEGTATITAKTENGQTDTLLVTVIGEPVTALKCTNTPLTLLKGTTTAMALEITPATTKEVIQYESSNDAVATVDASGNITAVGPGSARIRATAPVYGKTADCNVTVPSKGQTFVIGKYTYSVNGGNTLSFYSAPYGLKTVTIPATASISGIAYKVTTVAANACAGRTTVKKITVGANVKTIGKNAFTQCTAAKTMTIKSKVLTKVGKGAVKTMKQGATFKLPKSKFGKYKKLLKKSGVPKKAKFKKF